MTGLRIALFGEPHAGYGGEPWPLKVTRTGWALLSELLAHERPVARESLAAAIWPDCDRAESLANLRRHLHMVGRGLPPSGEAWIVSDSKTVAWNRAAGAWVDVVEFGRLLEQGRDREAVEIYRDELLPRNVDDVVLARRERLRAAYLDALERLIAQARASRAFTEALEYAQRLLAVDEWREDAVRAYMTAKYESGDGPSALEAYDRLARRLREEFGAMPAEQTNALRKMIVAGLPLPKPFESAGKALFVGRAEPLEHLGALWSRVASGNGGVAFISGEAGIGKSRLALEFATLVRERGGRVLAGTTSTPESEPYEAIVTALRNGLDGSVTAIADVWLAPLARVIPAIHRLRGDLVLPEERSSDGARDRLFESIARAIEHLSQRQPLCLVFEDLQWAGPGTMELVAALARRVGALPVAIVATYRSEESAATGGVRSLRTRLVHERRAIACPLERLRPGEVSAIVDACVDDAAPELRASVASLSDGNPLFVAQLVASYLETGTRPSQEQLPRDVGDAIAARLRLLDPGVRAIAEAAATIGASFGARVLAAAGGWRETDVLDALGSLMDRGIVRETGSPLEYAFAHALFSATLYSESPFEPRAARHLRIAMLLEDNVAHDAAAAGSIARHWMLAGDRERAARAYLRAAQFAVEVFAYDEALERCALALELGADRGLLRETLLVREAVHGFQARRDEQRRDLLELEAIARDDGSAELTWEILRRRAMLARATDDLGVEAELLRELGARASASKETRWMAEAKKLAAAHALAFSDNALAKNTALDALALFAELGDEAREIEILCLLARIESDRGDLPATERYLERARARMQTPDRIAMLNATMAAANAANQQQHFGATHALASTALEICREIGYREREGDARNLIGIALTRLGDFSGARDALTHARDIFSAMGRTFGVAAMALNTGVLEWRLGYLEAAYAQIATARSLLQELKNAGGQIIAANNLAGICIGMGRYEEAIALAQEALLLSRRSKQPAYEATALGVLGYAERSNGDARAAIGHLEAALAIHRVVERPVDNLETLAELSLAHLASGNREAARSSIDEVFEAPDEAFEHALWPQLYHWVAARVYHACGDVQRAQVKLDAAVAAMLTLETAICASQDTAAFTALPLNVAIARARDEGIWPAP